MFDRVKIFGIEIDRLTMNQAVSRLLSWIDKQEYRCLYVVTPNVDHIVKLQNNEDFRAVYKDAEMVVVDGKPVLLASRLLNKSLPETVPGSDLCPALFEAARTRRKLRIFLLGAADGVADRAATVIQKRWPWVEICGTHSPPMGFSALSPANEIVLKKINSVKPDVLVIGLGAPKQEIWVHAMRDQLDVKVALCVGATIDFLAGEKARAPHWIRKIGLEWLHRALSEPRRLLPRYIHDAWVFPRLVIREWLSK
ncbi:WecB/TagA/CpsF family glycosyltransferase [Nitrosomonas sp. Nm166]|uniref:WecB/TagA/CpsF family glycosyltransferase n=1 Tax=Nitrosomonas sp. Nm166 TaxID=1881054 RepID=UPI0008F333C0|nr:WecB/TagA/CpsF family glycosyltransferase [Nitrosomonas sp. Nm166]SFD95423.1 N-acetylglucosaminyldiphosphoundecaprenol N-acetyl-beta-D-mannosaminyltransferase [Nitrosomonas sp. Nm166]